MTLNEYLLARLHEAAEALDVALIALKLDGVTPLTCAMADAALRKSADAEALAAEFSL
jgi:hypothetical protein